jgi:hypothetical protein
MMRSLVNDASSALKISFDSEQFSTMYFVLKFCYKYDMVWPSNSFGFIDGYMNYVRCWTL